MKNNLHIVPSEGDWAVRISGSVEPLAIESTQEKAIAAALEIAADHEADVVVHRRDGTFRNVIGYEAVKRRVEEAESGSKFCCSKLFWSIFAVGAVGGLTAYLILNPPPRLESWAKEIDPKFREWVRVGEFTLLDTQFTTPHLESLGARAVRSPGCTRPATRCRMGLS